MEILAIITAIFLWNQRLAVLKFIGLLIPLGIFVYLLFTFTYLPIILLIIIMPFMIYNYLFGD